MTQPEERRSGDRPNKQLQKLLPVAFAAQVPVYFLIAWFLGSQEPAAADVGSDRTHIVVFALVAFAGLSSAFASVGLRSLVTLRAGGSRAARHMNALFIALVFAEVPALLGLVYFVLYRDWGGFALMQIAGLIAFIIHAVWKPSRASLGRMERVHSA